MRIEDHKVDPHANFAKGPYDSFYNTVYFLKNTENFVTAGTKLQEASTKRIHEGYNEAIELAGGDIPLA